MDNKKEIERHKRVMDSIRNANSKEEIPNVSLSNIASYLASNAYFDDRHISQSLFKPVMDCLIDYGFFGMPQVRDVFIKILKDNYPGKSDEEYLNKYNAINSSNRVTNILIEVSEKMGKLQKFQDEEDLSNHKKLMKEIENCFVVKELPSIGIGDLNRTILRDFNNNDFIKNIRVGSIRKVTNAYMDGKDYKDIDDLVIAFCEKQNLYKDNRELMYNQIRSNLFSDKKIKYIVEEIKAKEKRKLKIYELDHEENMGYIKDATRISQLPPNTTVSYLNSYLSGNSTIFVNGDKISTVDLKNLTNLLLGGKKWESDEVCSELRNICSKYYNDKEDIAYKLLSDKFKSLPRTYYLVEEINACNKRIAEFTKNRCSNVNVYFIPNNKSPIDGGRFYNCYINRVDNLDLGELLPLNLEDIVPPEMDIDSVEWFIQENHDKTFKAAGGIILNRDETIGNVNVFRPNEGEVISKEEKSNYDKLIELYEETKSLLKRRNKEQEEFFKSQKSIDSRLDEIQEMMENITFDIKKGHSRKKVKEDEE